VGRSGKAADVGLEAAFEQLLKEFLFEVATPELERRFDPGLARALVTPAGPPGTRVAAGDVVAAYWHERVAGSTSMFAAAPRVT